MTHLHHGVRRAALAAVTAAVLLVAGCSTPAESPEAAPTPSTESSVELAPADVTPPPTLPDGTPTLKTGRTLTLPAEPVVDQAALDQANALKRMPVPPASTGKTVTPRKLDDDEPPYYYGVGSQFAQADGVYADMDIAAPSLASGDYHTLAEVAAQSADGQQIVEIGWHVDPAVEGNTTTRLFVFSWVNRKTCGYNTNSKPIPAEGVTAGCTAFKLFGQGGIVPGMALPTGTTKKFGIQRFDGNWWISYDHNWVGYYEGTQWSNAQTPVTFNKLGLFQVFGEVVAASTTAPCSSMGNNQFASGTSPTQMRNVSLVNGPAVNLNVGVSGPSTADPISQWYTAQVVGKQTFKYGGPGSTSC